MCHVCVNTVCVNSVWGNIGNDRPALFPGALCFRVFVCIKRLRTPFLAWLCLQKGNQARCPKPVGGANRFWASLQFVHVREQHTHTNTRTYRHTHNAYEANKQTNKQTGIQIFFSRLSLEIPPPPKHRHTHTRTNTRSLTENHHWSRLRNRLPIHHSVHFSREWPCA